MAEPNIQVVIPAAGSGRRMGAGTTPKQYQTLLGRPLLSWTINRFLTHPALAGVTVVLSEDDQAFHDLPLAGPVATVTGGATRAESVRNGVAQVLERQQATTVLVHDAARPCLGRAPLDRLLEAGLGQADGAILALPVADTLKRSGGGQPVAIEATVSREQLWAAQTPQLFPASALLDALDASLARGDAPTDEAGAMEAAGYQPRLVQGCAKNIKVTWPGDLALAELLLQNLIDEEAS